MKLFRMLIIFVLLCLVFTSACSTHAPLTFSQIEADAQINDNATSSIQNPGYEVDLPLTPSPSPKETPTPTTVLTTSPAPSPFPSVTPKRLPKQVPPPSSAIEVTPSPTPNPKTTPSIDNNILGVPENSPVPMSYFDDVLFIGDSNTWRLKNFVHNKRQSDEDYMGKTTFLSTIGYGLHDAAIENKPIQDENDQEWDIVDYLKRHRYNKIYIMLGTNDLGAHSIDMSVKYYLVLIRRIKKVSSADIYIQSVLPMCKSGQLKYLNNANIDQFNMKMYEHSKSLGCYYLDVASSLKDSGGHLPKKYSTDNYVHIANVALPLWVDYLRTHTK